MIAQGIGAYAHALATEFTDPDSPHWRGVRTRQKQSRVAWERIEREEYRNAFPYPKTRWDINCGHCEEFATQLGENFPGGKVIWLDELYLNDQRTQPPGFGGWPKEKQEEWCEEVETPNHCVYLYEGKYHDAENPEGVKDWMALEVMQNKRLTRAEWVLRELRAELASAAQGVYEGWEQDEEGIDPELGTGGICGRITDAMAGVLAQQEGWTSEEGGQEGDDHSFLVAAWKAQRFGIDIAPHTYEWGAGYTWRKKPDIQLKDDDVIVWELEAGTPSHQPFGCRLQTENGNPE